MKTRLFFNNGRPVSGLNCLLVYGSGIFMLVTGMDLVAQVYPAHAQQSISQKPGIQFHKSLPRKIGEEISIIDDFTVEVGLGLDQKFVSCSIEDAVQSIPVVGKDNKPAEAFIGSTGIFKQKNGLYTWDKAGRKDVRLSAKYVRSQGGIRVSVAHEGKSVGAMREPQIEREEKTVEPVPQPEKADDPIATVEQKPARITGFRSAHFGMIDTEILKAIGTDFQIGKDKVERMADPMKKIAGLAVTVPNLLAHGGPAKVAYVLGHQTKKLIQVNVLWGFPVNPNPDARALASIANTLRDHFLKKGFPAESTITNQHLGDGSILVFRGTDRQGRMVVLLINTVQNPQNSGDSSAQKPKAFLRLSYIENLAAQDVFHIKPEDF